MNDILFNIDTAALSNYKLGDVIPKKFEGEYYQNFNAGYGIYLSDEKISTIVTYFRKGYYGFDPFIGEIVFKGKKHCFNKDTNYDEVISIFGKPDVKWNDGVEMCAEFLFGDKRLEIIWHVDGATTLDYISVEYD